MIESLSKSLFIGIESGQTNNVLVTADQQLGSYYMGMRPYTSAHNIDFQKSPTLALLQYQGSSNFLRQKLMLPKFNDNQFPQLFMNALKSLANEENPVNVPQTIDKDLFFTIGLNGDRCKSSSFKKHCQGPNGGVDGKTTMFSGHVEIQGEKVNCVGDFKVNAELHVTLEKLRSDHEIDCHNRWHFHEGTYVRTDGYGLFLLL